MREGVTTLILRFFFLFIGFGLAVAGGVTIIAFLNLLTMGNTFTDYLIFMSQRLESYIFLAGILTMWLAVYFPSR